MTLPLENLAGPSGPLVSEPPDDAEIAGLVRSGRLRLADARNPSLSLDSRFDLAYNAAHALSLAALRSRGYRARHRYIVFQALPHTLGLGPGVWRCSPRRTICATWPNTRATSTSTSGWCVT
ncbi:hypothetical protein [Dokdonella sp.]|uniref:hypothetical protein n=1 Tax=Dokdonella sp. TaxID=2291710 RepID=UPI0025C305BB|nr:hypothetical protein [Dokdonella sp.]